MVTRRSRDVSGCPRVHRLSALFAVGVALGLRRGELLALAWDDVDLDGGSFGCGERSNACGVKVWCLGRRSRQDRVGASHLPESSRAALLSHRERQEVERLTAGDSWQESGLVFTTSLGHSCGAAKSVQDFRASGAAVRRASDPVP